MHHHTSTVLRPVARAARMAVAGVALAATALLVAAAPASSVPAPSADAQASEKRIVLDNAPLPSMTPSMTPPTTPTTPPSPTAQGAPGAAVVAPTAASGAGTPVASAWHDAVTAATLGDLGLALLRLPSAGPGPRNVAYSPWSVASALALVHAGSAGAAASELSALVEPAVAGGQFYTRRLPALIQRLDAAPGGQVRIANRLWLRADVASSVPGTYAALTRERFGADVGLYSRGGEPARAAINEWVSARTSGAVPQLLPAGSVTPTTKLVLVNAVHFKSPWARPFDPRATVPRPFATPDGPQPVPTMVGERAVRRGSVDGMEVIEIPFVDRVHALRVAMPARTEPLPAAEQRLAGADLASWGDRLEPGTCRVHLPRFSVAAQAQSLKPPLAALGVRTVFSDRADLRPMLGRAATGAQVDDVFHAASVVIDERGGEAAAGTAATVMAKSLAMPAPDCVVDRPFLFAIVHVDSGTPLFVGRVTDPR